MKKPFIAKTNTPETRGGGGELGILWIVLLLLLIFGMTSCGPQAKLRRAERLIAKAEAAGAVWKVDTVFKTIEVPVPQVRTDTVFQSQVGDTVYLTKDRLQVKYVRLPGDSVFIEGECLPDTIKILTTVTVNKEISARKRSWTFYVAWALLLILAGIIGGYILRGKKQLTIRVDNKPPDIQ